jgi:hypothetical protein
VKDDVRFDGKENESIERALSGLRQVEAPAGLEDRVLQAMRHKREAAEEHVDSPWPTRWLSWIGLGLAATAALLMVATTRHQHNSDSGEQQSPGISAARLPEPAAESKAPRNGFDGPVSVKPERRQVHRVVRQVHAEQVMGFPAPEPPLTEEEKLLQRIARSGDQQQLAMLSPELRAKDEAASEAEFKQFEQNRNEENTRRTVNESSQNE